MPASDEFKKALRSGDLPEAFVMAMGKATELKITTQVVKADGSIAAEYNPAHALETRLDILNGTIENRVGEEFVGTGKYRELQQFHQQQVALGNRKIQENFQSLQQLFRLLVTLQQYNRINNAEKPLDLTFLEVPSQALPPEKVVTTLQEQAAILETIAEVQSAAAEDLDLDFGLAETDFSPSAGATTTPDKIKLTAPPPPQVNRAKPAPEAQPTAPESSSTESVTDKVKQVAIATGAVAAAAAIAEVLTHSTEDVPAPPIAKQQDPEEETLGFLDSFSALDLDDTPEPLMPLSDVEMDDWETPVELTPAQRLSQMPSETYVPSLNDFDHDPVATEDGLDDLLADDDLDDLFEDETTSAFADDLDAEALGTVEETVLEPITDEIETIVETANFTVDTDETVDFATDDLPDFAGDDFGDFMDETMDAADDFAVVEAPIEDTETVNFATDDLPDFSGDDFGGFMDETMDTTDDFAVAAAPIEDTETVDFAADDLPDFSGDDFGGFMDETMDATDDFAVAAAPIEDTETVNFAADDLPDFSGDDFGGFMDETMDTTDDFAVAESPIEDTETVDFATDDFGGWTDEAIETTEDLVVASPMEETLESVDMPDSAPPATPSMVEPALTEAVEAAAPTQTAPTTEPVVEDSPLDNINDSELLDFLGQDWRSNPEVAEIASLDEDAGEPLLIQPLTEEELATLEEVEDMEDDWQPLGIGEDSFSGLQNLGFDTDNEEEAPSFAAEMDGDDFDDGLEDDWQPLDADGTAATEMSSFALSELTNPDSPTGLLALELDDDDDDLAAADQFVAIADEENALDADTFTAATDLDNLDMSGAETDVESSLDDADLDLSMADSPEDFDDFNGDDLDGTDLDGTNLDQTGFDPDLSMDNGDHFGDMDDFDDTDVELAMMEEDRNANMSGDLGSLGSLHDAVGNSDLDMEAFDSPMDGLTDDLGDLELEGLGTDASLELGADELELLGEENSMFGRSEPEAIATDVESDSDLLPDPFSEDNENWLNDDPNPGFSLNALEDHADDLNDLGDMAIEPLGDLDLGDAMEEPDFSEDLDADMEMNIDDLDLTMDDSAEVDPFAMDTLDDDDMFSQDVMNSIQELDASTASLESDNSDLSDNSIFAGLEESIEGSTAEYQADTSMPDPFPADGELDLDMDSLVLESSLELNDFGATDDDLANFSFGDDLTEDATNNMAAIAPDMPNMMDDSLDDMDLDFGVETDDLMGSDSDFDNFDSPIDLAMGLEDDLSNFANFDVDKGQNPPSEDDWGELENVDLNPSAVDSWDELQPATHPPTKASTNATAKSADADGAADWAMDMGNLDALNDLEDADLSGLGDFDLESIEADDSDSDFDFFGDENSDSFNPFETQA